jgi:hypothetical protein
MERKELAAWSDLYLGVLNEQTTLAFAELYEWLKLVVLVDPDTEFCYPDLPANTIIPLTQKITIDKQEATAGGPKHTKLVIDSPPLHITVPPEMSTEKFPALTICVVAVRDNRAPCWFWLRVAHKEFVDSRPVVHADLKIVYSTGGTYVTGPAAAESQHVIEWINDVS